MAQGKFSAPREHRDEERQIEEAFRQVTGKASQRSRRVAPQESEPEFSALFREEPIIDPDPDLDPAVQETVSRPRVPTQQDEEDFYSFLEETLSPGSQPASSAQRQAPPHRPAQTASRPSYQEPPRKTYAAAQVKRVTGHSPEPEEEDPDFLERLAVFWQKHQKAIVLGITLFALLLVIGIGLLTFLRSSDPYDNRILNNVYLADISIGGMTKSEAVSAVKKATDQTYSVRDMVISLGDQELRLSPQRTGIKLNVTDAVNAAFAYGRTGTQSQQNQEFQDSQTNIHTIALLPYLELDTDYIQQVLSEYAKEIGSTLTQPSFVLEGQALELSTDRFDPNLTGQTLVITMGTPGIGFDANAAYNEILDAYSLHRFQVFIDASDTLTQPAEPDLDALYQMFYIAPVNGSVDMQTLQTIPGSYGVSFDLDLARSLVSAAQSGETLRIPLVYTAPEQTGSTALFQDVLGECQTRHTSDENRNTNLRLACAALDGLVLQPGELFSYNDTLGERTAAKGYKPAPAYSGLELVDSIGGGICQGSSTLYNCVLLADLEVVERLCHGFTVGYLPMGLDATVSWGFADFKFRNTSNFPIMIKAEVSDGYVKMKILGTDDKDYYVKMESTYSVSYEPETVYVEYPENNPQGYRDGQVLEAGTTGYYARSYKLKYDKQTGALISREVEANSSYIKVDRVVVRIVRTETTPKPTETTEPPEPTTPPTEKPSDSGGSGGESGGSGGESGGSGGESGGSGGESGGSSGESGSSGGESSGSGGESGSSGSESGGSGGESGSSGGESGGSGGESSGSGSESGTSGGDSGSSGTGNSGTESGSSTPAEPAPSPTPSDDSSSSANSTDSSNSLPEEPAQSSDSD